MRFALLLSAVTLFAVLPAHSVAQNIAASLAPTPPMGWNSWNHFADKVDDRTIRETADLMVSTGMRDAGYIYVNIDDTWEGTRDAQGHIHANSKFPDMKARSAMNRMMPTPTSPGASTISNTISAPTPAIWAAPQATMTRKNPARP